MIESRAWRRIAVAAAVSGVVHAAVIAFGRVELLQPPAELLPLAVRIVGAPLPAAVEPARPPRRERVARAPNLPIVSAHSPFVIPREPETEPIERQRAPSKHRLSEPAPVEAPAEPVVVAKAEPSTYAPQPLPGPNAPRKGRITYDLVYGRDRFPVGRTVQSWEMDGTRYQLGSSSETTGIIDLFRSQHRNYFSRGAVTREGLRPETFLMSRNRGRGLEEARAHFDWTAASVMLGPATAQRREQLPQGSQDLLSFMYQLALDPPRPGRLRVPVTNGSGLDTYELEVLPEETIETPLGRLRALPLKQLRVTGEESIELWLAAEYRYLPVRIRFFNREGEPAGEQLVSEIRLSEE